jgi:Flp pilus assembly protein CpaB
VVTGAAGQVAVRQQAAHAYHQPRATQERNQLVPAALALVSAPVGQLLDHKQLIFLPLPAERWNEGLTSRPKHPTIQLMQR